MRDKTFTLTTALCGVAGAIVMACTPAPGHAEPPPLHGCHQLVPHFTSMHTELRRGVHTGILRYIALTDDRLGGTGRAVVLAVLDAVDTYPDIKMLPASKFVPAATEFCIAAVDKLPPVDRQRSPQQHGDI